MAKIVRALFALLLTALPAAAQVSFVTTTGTNANYPNGTIQAIFLPPANSSQFDYLNERFPFTQTATLNGSGTWSSLIVADTSTLKPAGSQWQFFLCSQKTFAPSTCFPVTMAVTCVNNVSCSGSTLNLTSSFSAAPAPATTVQSFNGRSGLVTPAAGDYTAALVTNAADLSKTTQQSFQGILGSPLFAGTAAVTIAPNTAVAGTGATATCLASVTCTATSGVVSVQMGTTTPTAGVIFTVTNTQPSGTLLNCIVEPYGVAGSNASTLTWQPSAGAAGQSFSAVAMQAGVVSGFYAVVYSCQR